jgi:hypothetical protein
MTTENKTTSFGVTYTELLGRRPTVLGNRPTLSPSDACALREG